MGKVEVFWDRGLMGPKVPSPWVQGGTMFDAVGCVPVPAPPKDEGKFVLLRGSSPLRYRGELPG